MSNRNIENALDKNLLAALARVELLVGKTPLYRIEQVFQKENVEIYAKLEYQQIGNSVKSRPAFNIIKQAILSGSLDRSKRLLDATSGNTGIAYAAIGAALGLGVTLCMPENASPERKKILRALGADIIFTSQFEGTDGAQVEAAAIAEQHADSYFLANQYANPANWQAHFEGTAPEIWAQTHGRITHFVAGLGTTGTFTGTGRGLRAFKPDVQLIALQPNNPMHGLEGWKHLETAIVPKIYDASLADTILEIDTLESWEMLKALAKKEGLLLSPSSAANLLGAIQVAKSIEEGVIVTTFADSADKYGEVLELIF